jgi:hypothetical protein
MANGRKNWRGVFVVIGGSMVQCSECAGRPSRRPWGFRRSEEAIVAELMDYFSAPHSVGISLFEYQGRSIASGILERVEDSAALSGSR